MVEGDVPRLRAIGNVFSPAQARADEGERRLDVIVEDDEPEQMRTKQSIADDGRSVA